ncbi:hypothetical protein Salat_1116400 [Sesamum alatum]|uniref:Uncharacterized protein n=1 Tax=Sesamum alatum TaxID=300844 RepID=A0AAE1YNJ5_9LAMI|nr:hypothetical protein Salat_1116400 [Sesamum alatum]
MDCGWWYRIVHHTVAFRNDLFIQLEISLTAEPTLAQLHHPGCEPPEKQAITASGWSSMEPRSKAVDKIEKGARLPVEERRRILGGSEVLGGEPDKKLFCQQVVSSLSFEPKSAY